MTIPTEMITEEWALWTHHCGRHVSKSQWEDTTQESSHFFAQHPKKIQLAPTQEPFCNLEHLPLPSQTFFLKGKHCKAPQTHVEYSVFRQGVFPKWEDPQCAGEWYTKHFFPPKLLDQYWNSLVRGVMTGKIDPQYIAGIRVVDKSHSKHPLYRLELWLNTDVQRNRDMVRDQAMKCISMDSHYAFKFHWRKFDDELKKPASSDGSCSRSVSPTTSMDGQPQDQQGHKEVEAFRANSSDEENKRPQ